MPLKLSSGNINYNNLDHFLFLYFRSLSDWIPKPASYSYNPRGRGNHAQINKNKIPTGTKVIQPRPKKPPLSMFQKFLVDAFVSIVYPVH